MIWGEVAVGRPYEEEARRRAEAVVVVMVTVMVVGVALGKKGWVQGREHAAGQVVTKWRG